MTYPVSPAVLALNPGAAREGLITLEGQERAKVANTMVNKAKPDKKHDNLRLKAKGTAPKESESSFQSWVIELAKHRGFLVAHFRGGWSKDGKRYNTPVQGDSGFPDVVLAKVGRVIFAELKTDTGKLSAEQVEWGRVLSLSAEYYVWRPSDRAKIEEILK